MNLKQLKEKLRENGYKGKFNLSELISAISEEDIGLLSLDECEDWWEAILKTWDIEVSGGYEPGDEIIDWTKGKTPEEAVAKLWLKLFK